MQVRFLPRSPLPSNTLRASDFRAKQTVIRAGAGREAWSKKPHSDVSCATRPFENGIPSPGRFPSRVSSHPNSRRRHGRESVEAAPGNRALLMPCHRCSVPIPLNGTDGVHSGHSILPQHCGTGLPSFGKPALRGWQPRHAPQWQGVPRLLESAIMAHAQALIQIARQAGRHAVFSPFRNQRVGTPTPLPQPVRFLHFP